MAGQQHLPFVCQASGSVLAVEERRPCTACTPLTLARPGDTQEMVFTVRLLSLSLRVRGEVGHAILTQIFSSVCLAWRGVTYHPFLEHHSLLLTFKSISPLFRLSSCPSGLMGLFSGRLLLSSWLSPSHYTAPLTTCHFELRDPEKNEP